MGIVEPIEIVKEKGKYPYILYPLSVSRASPAKKIFYFKENNHSRNICFLMFVAIEY
jgi:hypothetical protein